MHIFVFINLYVYYSIFILLKWITNDSTVYNIHRRCRCRLVWMQATELQEGVLRGKNISKDLCYIVKHTYETLPNQ